MGIMVNQYNFVKQFSDTVIRDFRKTAVTEYPGQSITYKELAINIHRLHQLWEKCGIKRGDKIAICAKNSINWITIYMAAVTAGCVAVLLSENQSSDIIEKLVTHSNSKLIYADKSIYYSFSSNFAGTSAIIDIRSQKIIRSNSQFSKYLDCASDSDLSMEISEDWTPNYYVHPNDACTLLYTSGTTNNPKGVLLSIKNISVCIHGVEYFPFNVREERNILNIVLPFSHIFGLLDNAIIPLCLGLNTVVLTKVSTPANICKVMNEYKPRFVFLPPLIVQKIIEYIIGFEIDSAEGRDHLLSRMDDDVYFLNMKTKVISALGGRLELFCSGGASFTPFVEQIIHKINLPLASGYGMTECGIVTVDSLKDGPNQSCGKILPLIQVRVCSEDPRHIPGEIQIRGDNVFIGYYNNQEATAAVFTGDGWFKTGDMGIIDENDHLFITGRCKDMILTSNGQNIYPEEIEDILNSFPYISESLIIQKGEKLHALIVIDTQRTISENIDNSTLDKTIECYINEVNQKLPGFALINTYSVRKEPFERALKGGVKRYLYE